MKSLKAGNLDWINSLKEGVLTFVMIDSRYQIRPYIGSDETSLITLWNQTMTLDTISVGRFRTKVLLDLNFNPEGLLVCQSEGDLVGFVLSIKRQVPLFTHGLEPELSWITAFGVHPDHRRRGIGTHLLKATTDRLRRSGCTKTLISPYTPNYFIPGVDIKGYPDAIAFLGELGWITLYKSISMQADINGFQIPESMKETERRLNHNGIHVRPIEPSDIMGLFPFIQQHFGWDWVRFAREYLHPLFDQGSQEIVFLVAAQGDQIVGYCQQRGERFGPFGVTPDMRSKGIGRVLLFRCLEEMASRSIHCAWFLWTSEEATRLYALAGFKEARQFAVMEKTL
jgi:GNAT superfamily N-acetyltransferase